MWEINHSSGLLACYEHEPLGPTSTQTLTGGKMSVKKASDKPLLNRRQFLLFSLDFTMLYPDLQAEGAECTFFIDISPQNLIVMQARIINRPMLAHLSRELVLHPSLVSSQDGVHDGVCLLVTVTFGLHSWSSKDNSYSVILLI